MPEPEGDDMAGPGAGHGRDGGDLPDGLDGPDGLSTDAPHEYRLLSVIVPVFNERVTVDEVIRRIRAVEVPVDVEVIVV
ncbi:MAG: hypothetical protein ABSH30_16260, partial [Acidimicrobiales bacterium]